MNNVELVLGQTILIELEGECLIGNVIHVGSGRSFIRLSNVRDIATNKCFGTQTYYNSEIRNVQIVSETDEVASQASQSQTEVNEDVETIVKAKKLSLETLNDMLEQINSYVFVHQTDVKYHDTIRFLKKQKCFGIAMECIEEGRHAKSPSLLSIATTDSVYIFDIKWMKIPEDIRELLGSDRYRRVIHNGRLVRDVLQHKFGVTLGQCFDVLVAHIAITKTQMEVEKRLSIQACVNNYLNLPDQFFDSNINFHLRPLNDEAKREAAKNVVFLLPLQDLFIHEIILEPFYQNCYKYSHTLAGNPDFINSLADLRNNEDESLNAIEPVVLGIDLESAPTGEPHTESS